MLCLPRLLVLNKDIYFIAATLCTYDIFSESNNCKMLNYSTNYVNCYYLIMIYRRSLSHT